MLPIAIEKLNKDILAEGDFNEGDLLCAVLQSDLNFWKSDKINHKFVCEIFQKNQSNMKDFDTTWEIKKKWFDSFKEFELINQNVG